MYFTNTPYLNSMEAIMIRPPGSIQRGGGKNRSPYKYTKKDCECRFCLYYRKKDGCTVPICPVLDIRLSCGAASFREAVKSVFSEVKHIPFQRLDLGQVFRHIGAAPNRKLTVPMLAYYKGMNASAVNAKLFSKKIL